MLNYMDSNVIFLFTFLALQSWITLFAYEQKISGLPK